MVVLCMKKFSFVFNKDGEVWVVVDSFLVVYCEGCL